MGNEFLPIVRPFRHDVQHIFRADNLMKIRFRISVDGGEEHHAVRLYQLRTGFDDGGGIGNVFHHFHTGYNIETVRLFGGEVFDADVAVIYIVHAFGSSMGLGGLQRFLKCEDSIAMDRRIDLRNHSLVFQHKITL